jgi:pimeloyl-ACP methyl ester carboxylesterase
VLRAFAEGSLFGEQFGTGPVRVVWLHGWGRRASDFAGAADELARAGVASVALELPGFGATPALDQPGGARTYAAVLSHQLADVATDPVILVGHSFGGAVAVGVADLVPQSVAGLVLVASPVLRRPVSSPSARFRVVRTLHRLGIVSDARMETLRQQRGSADYRAANPEMRRVLVASLAESFDAELARWRGPTTLVWGERDRDVAVSVAHSAAELLTTPPQLVVLPGVGHLVPTEAPHALASSVTDLL